MWKRGANGATTRKILFFEASRAHCQAEATSEMAVELPPEEQVEGEDLIGELLNSLYGTRKAAQDWEKKWQRVIIDRGFFIGTGSPAIVVVNVCCVGSCTEMTSLSRVIINWRGKNLGSMRIDP